MKLGKQYSSVSEMVHDLSDKAFADDFDKRIAEKEFIDKCQFVMFVNGSLCSITFNAGILRYNLDALQLEIVCIPRK